MASSSYGSGGALTAQGEQNGNATESNSSGNQEIEELRLILKKQEDKAKGEYEEREYQNFLFEKAKEENVIICLPTGCGKTFVAVQLVKHYLPDSVRDGKKIMFVATTVQLVHQQGKYLKEHISSAYSGSGSHVMIVTGDMKPEDWLGDKWKAILMKAQVFAMTDQILRSAIEKGFIRWEQISLLILDECHNATKTHPMAALMDNYRLEFIKNTGERPENPLPLPRVLGLTATIIKGNVKSNIRQDIRDIEQRFVAKAITYSDYEQVLKCATSAKVKILSYKAGETYEEEYGLATLPQEMIANLRIMARELVDSGNESVDVIGDPTLKSTAQFYEKQENPVKNYEDVIRKIEDVLKELGPYAALNAALKNSAYLYMKGCEEERKGRGCIKAVILIINYLLTQLDLFINHLQDYMAMHADPMSTDKDFILKYISPKLKLLIETLETTKPSKANEDSPLCGLIFCQTRFTTQMVCHYLQELSILCPERFGFIRTNFVIGGSSSVNYRSEIASRISMAKQQDILNQFRQKQLNLLVCTNVLEEGLNVPSCNFILRFDPIQTYPSFVQSMGRARQRGARFYALVADGVEVEQSKKLSVYERFSVDLSECLKQNVLHPEKYYDDEADITMEGLNQLIPPFMPGGGPQKITAGSAIQIVYQYCQLLTSDKLSLLAPVSWWTKELQFKAFVALPPNSVVKKAEGGCFDSKYVAKKSVFMEVCKKLYEAGALHPETLLPIPRALPQHASNVLNELEKTDEKALHGKKLGSKNRVLWYEKQISEMFKTEIKSCPQDRKLPLKLYGLVIRLKTYLANPDIEHLLHFEDRSYFFGILTHADLAKVQDFLLLSRDGNFAIHLEEIALTESITQEKITSLKDFQRSIFADLLGMLHPVLTIAEDSPYYVVPLQTAKCGDVGTAKIAWNLIPKLASGREVDYGRELSIAERRGMTFEEEKYDDAVVTPFYSPKHHGRQMYCVSAMETNRSPSSPFDIPDAAPTYEIYYRNKYNITIINKQQPLLLAKARSKQLNYLVAKYEQWKLSKEERIEARYMSRTITLIPELVRIHPLPACLFIQAKMVPSCLHRIMRLLLAEEIREAVAKEFMWVDTPAVLKQRNDAFLEKQNEEIAELAKPLLNPPVETAPTVGDQVQISGPSTSKAATGPNEPSSAVSGVDNITRVFNATRRLLWCEIEYILPKAIKLEAMGTFKSGGYAENSESDDSEEEEDDAMEEGEILNEDEGINVNMESAESDSLLDLSPPSPSAEEISGIELIRCEDVPFQNFDAPTNFEESKGPLASTIMEALTLANGNDSMSLEKLEMIGDSVLKFIATVHIFSNFPEWNEGNMTATRMRLICNRHLYILGKRKNLGAILAGSLFEPENSWLPPGYEVLPKFIDASIVDNEINFSAFLPIRNNEGKLEDIVNLHTYEREELSSIVAHRISSKAQIKNVKANTSYTHSRLGDKNIADCVESLIGAYYLHGGLDSALRLMTWMGLRGPENTPEGFCVYKSLRDLPKLSATYPSHQQNFIPFVEDIEKTLNYTFKNKWLVVEALTHPSYIKNQDTSAYERLEFLGDAVLDFLVTHFIYQTKKAETPGKLTDLRSALVNNITFGSLAVRYGFHKSLLHFSNDLQDAIDLFVSYQVRNNHKVTGHFELINDRDCLVAEDIDVPKALGDVFESLTGAVFVDSGMSLDTVWTVFYRLMKNEFDMFSENIPKAPVRELYEEFPGKIKFESLKYPKLEESGLKVVKVDVPGFQVFRGAGRKKGNAKAAAAKFALKLINAKKSMDKKTSN